MIDKEKLKAKREKEAKETLDLWQSLVSDDDDNEEEKKPIDNKKESDKKK